MIDTPSPSDIDEELIAPVRGSLLARIIHAVLENRWSTGWGLISEKGVNGGLISLDPTVIPELDGVPYWRGKVTASGSTSADHTIEEVDADDNIIAESDGGQKTETAKAYNERKGVPNDTLVIVFEHPPAASTDYADYKFLIPDGLTDSPADLTNVDVVADTTDWDVENQGSEDGADFDPSRTAMSVPALWFYDREMTVDSSGFVTKIGVERESFVAGDADDDHKDNHIALIDTTSGAADGKIVKINAPQGEEWERTLTLTAGDGIDLSTGTTAEFPLGFDDSGRNTNGPATSNVPVTISLANDPGDTGGGLPSGTSGQILVHDGNNWVAQNTVTETVFTAATIDGSDDLVFTRKTVTIIATAAAANATVAGEECP